MQIIKKDIKFKKIFEYVILLLLFLLSIKKGGFYKTDTLFFCFSIAGISILYFTYEYFENRNKKNQNRIDIISILLLILSFFYTLPILFRNYSNLSDSIFEMTRYFNIYLIYRIVKNSDNKKIFLNGIVIITIIQCLIGIDGLGNRYLSSILDNFNSGFLSRDITRLSGTIQYANVVAILCTISIIILLEKIKNIEKYNLNIKNILNFVGIFILFSSLLLTESRAALIFGVFAIIIYFILERKNIKNIFFTLLIQILFSILFTSIIQNNIINNPTAIYFYTAVAILINVIIYLVLNILNKNNIINKVVNNRLNISRNKLIIIFCLVFISYIIIGINVSKPLYIDSKSKENKESINVYNVNRNETNNINLKLDLKAEDTRYKITFIEVSDEFTSKVVKVLNYYNIIDTNINLSFDASNNAKYINIIIECEKGSLYIDELKMNNKNKTLKYAIIPTEIVSRIEDGIYGSTSIRDRIAYTEDSFKIIFNLPVNFLIGVGGEGFKNTYELFKSFAYSSTEAHNSFLQIFIESGVLGFITIISIIIIVVLKKENNYIKVALLLLIVHSFFDLNFSYLFMLCVFAILLACCDDKKINKGVLKDKTIEYLKFFESILCYFFLILNIYILINANFAYYLGIPKYKQEELTLEKQINVVNLMEKRVNLDPGENVYRQSLNEEYSVYFDMLIKTISGLDDKNPSKKVLEEEVKNVIENIKTNADNMVKNSKYDRNIILKVSDIYFNNLKYFTTIYYSKNIDEGYQIYLDYILKNVEYVENNYKNNSNIESLVKTTYNKYLTELKENKEDLNSIKIEEYINILERKIGT